MDDDDDSVLDYDDDEPSRRESRDYRLDDEDRDYRRKRRRADSSDESDTESRRSSRGRRDNEQPKEPVRSSYTNTHSNNTSTSIPTISSTQRNTGRYDRDNKYGSQDINTSVTVGNGMSIPIVSGVSAQRNTRQSRTRFPQPSHQQRQQPQPPHQHQHHGHHQQRPPHHPHNLPHPHQPLHPQPHHQPPLHHQPHRLQPPLLLRPMPMPPPPQSQQQQPLQQPQLQQQQQPLQQHQQQQQLQQQQLQQPQLHQQHQHQQQQSQQQQQLQVLPPPLANNFGWGGGGGGGGGSGVGVGVGVGGNRRMGPPTQPGHMAILGQRQSFSHADTMRFDAPPLSLAQMEESYDPENPGLYQGSQQRGVSSQWSQQTAPPSFLPSTEHSNNFDSNNFDSNNFDSNNFDSNNFDYGGGGGIRDGGGYGDGNGGGNNGGIGGSGGSGSGIDEHRTTSSGFASSGHTAKQGHKRQPCRIVDVNNMPQYLVNNSNIHSHFSQFGTIINIRVGTTSARVDNAKAAVVEFQNLADATKAVGAVDAVMGNRFVKVFYGRDTAAASLDELETFQIELEALAAAAVAKPTQLISKSFQKRLHEKRQPSRILEVQNIPSELNISVPKIYQHFCKFGSIVNVRVATVASNPPAAVATVEYENVESARVAIADKDAVLGNRFITVKFATDDEAAPDYERTRFLALRRVLPTGEEATTTTSTSTPAPTPTTTTTTTTLSSAALSASASTFTSRLSSSSSMGMEGHAQVLAPKVAVLDRRVKPVVSDTIKDMTSLYEKQQLLVQEQIDQQKQLFAKLDTLKSAAEKKVIMKTLTQLSTSIDETSQSAKLMLAAIAQEREKRRRNSLETNDSRRGRGSWGRRGGRWRGRGARGSGRRAAMVLDNRTKSILVASLVYDERAAVLDRFKAHGKVVSSYSDKEASYMVVTFALRADAEKALAAVSDLEAQWHEEGNPPSLEPSSSSSSSMQPTTTTPPTTTTQFTTTTPTTTTTKTLTTRTSARSRVTRSTTTPTINNNPSADDDVVNIGDGVDDDDVDVDIDIDAEDAGIDGDVDIDDDGDVDIDDDDDDDLDVGTNIDNNNDNNDNDNNNGDVTNTDSKDEHAHTHAHAQPSDTHASDCLASVNALIDHAMKSSVSEALNLP